MKLIEKVKFLKRLRWEAEYHANPYFRALAERDYRAWRVHFSLKHPMLSPMPMPEQRGSVWEKVGNGLLWVSRVRLKTDLAMAGAFAPSTTLISAPQEPNAYTPGNRFQIADTAFTTTRASGTTATQTLLAVATCFRAYIWLKTLVVGGNTGAQSGPLFLLQAADNSGMTTNLTVVGALQQADNVASATEVQAIVVQPTLVAIQSAPGKGFARVICDPTLMGAGSSGTFDCQMDAC